MAVRARGRGRGLRFLVSWEPRGSEHRGHEICQLAQCPGFCQVLQSHIVMRGALAQRLGAPLRCLMNFRYTLGLMSSRVSDNALILCWVATTYAGHRQDELLERAFWSSVTINPPLYGADNPTSLFDSVSEYGWNLNHLQDLLKKHDVAPIPGVTTPMVYFGMWVSCIVQNIYSCLKLPQMRLSWWLNDMSFLQMHFPYKFALLKRSWRYQCLCGSIQALMCAIQRYQTPMLMAKLLYPGGSPSSAGMSKM